MKIVVIDTETTGIPDFKAGSDAPHQPRVVEIGALVCDETGRVQQTYGALIIPTFEIPADVQAIHGITVEMATKYGVPAAWALENVGHMIDGCDVLVAHSYNFDAKMLKIEADRGSPYLRDILARAPNVCTLLAMKKLHPQITHDLANTYQVLFNETFQDAHRALPDAEACRRVYFALTAQQAITIRPPKEKN